MEIPVNIMNNLINYLARQPYKDVVGLIEAIVKLQALETNQKELPLDDN